MENDPFGNIWLTSRIRMEAHAKFVRFDRFSHILLTLYSVALLGFSVFEPHFSETTLGPFSSEISIVLSLSVLCASLVVWGLGFGEKARDHRECYLALQRLYDAPMEDVAKKEKYQEILDRYPNHSKLDNERFVFWRIVVEQGSLETARGPVKVSFLRGVKYLVWECLAILSTLILVASPAIVIVLIYAVA